jgi:predicted enzyme related to lactoylglutathione lyase
MSQTASTTRITQLRTVGIPVSDQDRALDFYVGTLGFEKRLDGEFGDGMRWIEVAPPGAATSIALMQIQNGEPIGIETQIRLSTDDAEADHAHLRAQGVEVDAEIMRWEGVPLMFQFQDPDGNRLVIVEG